MEKLKSFIRKIIDAGKDLIRAGITFLHEKLSQLEDYLLLKLTELGLYAERKLDERM